MRNLSIILSILFLGLPVLAEEESNNSNVKGLLKIPPIGYNYMLIHNGLEKESRTYDYRKKQIIGVKEDWRKLKEYVKNK